MLQNGLGVNDVHTKVHLLGASVTAQALQHKADEAIGHAKCLKVILSLVYNDLEFEVTSAGSSHFNDAGYCLLPGVINSRPDILALDWHAAGLTTFNEKF
jgi:hypothetical protein